MDVMDVTKVVKVMKAAQVFRKFRPVLNTLAACTVCALLCLPCEIASAAAQTTPESNTDAAAPEAVGQAQSPSGAQADKDRQASDNTQDKTQEENQNKSPDKSQGKVKIKGGKKAAADSAGTAVKTTSKEVLDAFNAGSFPEALESSVEEVGCPPSSPSFLCLNGYKTVRLRQEANELSHLYGNWQNVIDRHDPKKTFTTQNNKLMKAPVLSQWKNISSSIGSLPQPQQLRYVNGFFNSWPSVSDDKNYGQSEYWASPEEFLKNGGDCEDFAIAKYLALRHFGWKSEDLWVILLRDKKRSENHAVLAARAQDRIFILDNLSRPGYLLIPINDYLKTVTPFFAVNESGLLAFFQTTHTAAAVKKSKKTGNK